MRIIARKQRLVIALFLLLIRRANHTNSSVLLHHTIDVIHVDLCYISDVVLLHGACTGRFCFKKQEVTLGTIDWREIKY